MKLSLSAVLAAAVATITAKLVSDHIERAFRKAREEAKRAMERKEEEFKREKQALIACIEAHKAEIEAARLREQSAAKELNALHEEVQQVLLDSTRLKFMARQPLRARQHRRQHRGVGSGWLGRQREPAVRSPKVTRGTQTRGAGVGGRKQSDVKRREVEKVGGNEGLALVNSVRQLFGLDEGLGQRRRNEERTLRLDAMRPRQAKQNTTTS